MTASWATRRERGSPALMRLMLTIMFGCGYRVASALLPPITGYFYLTSRQARAASRDYLRRVFGREARARDVLRHFHSFATMMLDRSFLLADRTEAFTFTLHGRDHMINAIGRGGCLLFGAHIGSFEALRFFARGSPVPVRPVMFRAGNTGAATALIEALDPLLAAAIIPLGQPDSMLRIQESLRRGEIVTLLADRSPAPHEGPGRDFLIDFLGAPALFPAGPMMLAAMMQVPVFLAFGLCTGKRHYEVHFEPFADALPAIPARRWAELRGFGERYAARLATLCREHPFNWFNFFMFWENAHASPDVTRAHAPAVAGRNPPTGHPGAAGPGLGS